MTTIRLMDKLRRDKTMKKTIYLILAIFLLFSCIAGCAQQPATITPATAAAEPAI
jgi:uncharacterized lipoprotein YajG